MDGVDYSVLSDFFKQPEQLALTHFTVGGSPGKINLRMLVAGRIDATMGDMVRLSYQAAKEHLSNKITTAGCLPKPLPGYLLLPAKHRLTEQVMALVDHRIEAFQQEGKLEAIYDDYDALHSDASTQMTSSAWKY